MRRAIYNAFYPALIRAGRIFGLRAGVAENVNDVIPPVSFYSLTAGANDGAVINFENLKGKKVLIVNTASDCGYTAQFGELKQLYELFEGKLQVMAFPSNDFKEQEKGSDEEIADYCVGTLGIKFPVIKKSRVLKGDGQNPVFEWLTNDEKNGWNNSEPGWNFTKYLVNEDGLLTHYFGPGVSPLSNKVIHAINGKT